MVLTRRAATWLLAASAAAPIVGLPLAPVGAQELTVRKRGDFAPIPIAVTRFVGEGVSGDKVTGIVANDFKRSVFLSPVGGTPDVGNPDQPPPMDAFRNLGAQYVLTGRVARVDEGRLQTQFRLWDVGTGGQVAGEQYVTDANNLRRVAHIVADAVFAQATGEKGFFDTRVVFIDESGPATRRRKRLAIMDQDGASVRYLTGGGDLVVTPRFSPSSQDITYMAFGGSEPRVMTMNIETGQREAVGNFPGMTFAPRFGPGGQKIIMSLSEGASTNLYTMNLGSRETTRLTDTAAIDTAPSYAPDGSRICFESDRGGTPADLRDGGKRRRRAAHLVRRRPLLDPGVVAQGRLHRLHQAGQGRLLHRRHEARRLGRAHPHRGLPQRGADLGAQRAVPDVLPRPRRRGGLAHLHDGRFRPPGVRRADAQLRERPGLEPTAGGLRPGGRQGTEACARRAKARISVSNTPDRADADVPGAVVLPRAERRLGTEAIEGSPHMRAAASPTPLADVRIRVRE